MEEDEIDPEALLRKQQANIELMKALAALENQVFPTVSGKTKRGAYYVTLAHPMDIWGRRGKKFFDADAWVKEKFAPGTFSIHDYTYEFDKHEDAMWFAMVWG